MSCKDKVVVINDGGEGAGKNCARVFADAGAVVVIASSDEQKGNKHARELNEGGVENVYLIRFDPMKNEDFVKEVFDKFGRIDCLINIVESEKRKPIDEISVEEFRELLEVNLINTFAVCKTALPYLRLAKGNIINIPVFDAVPYNTTKGAINAFTKALAVDEAAYEVRVNSISIDVSAQAQQKEIFEEAAKMCLFLAADATFTTGVNHVIGNS